MPDDLSAEFEGYGARLPTEEENRKEPRGLCRGSLFLA
jgi:hypothetical protein